jgi:hypothetical protein
VESQEQRLREEAEEAAAARVRRIEQTVARGVAKMRLGAHSKAWEAWVGRVASAKRRRNLLRKTAGRMRSLELSRHFRPWATFARAAHTEKLREAALARVVEEAESAASARVRRIEQTLSRSVARLRLGALSAAWEAWAVTAAAARRRQNLLRKTAGRMRSLELSRHFQPWATLARARHQSAVEEKQSALAAKLEKFVSDGSRDAKLTEVQASQAALDDGCATISHSRFPSLQGCFI